MGHIHKLPPQVVNQIAAGEVIERPASVVKELLENALDASATRVEITVEQGGRDLIRVWDDGRGISADDLELALAPHATSKLETADDLFRVATFGFRGEALASIASISHLRLESRPAGAEAGAQIELVGDQLRPVTACGCPPGTTVEVRNLFFNVPVRRRFLKATQTEMGHIVEAFARTAIAHPRLAMTLRHNDKTVFDLPASAQLLERLALFFGQQLADRLIAIESQTGGRRLWGYVADPAESRSNARTQYFFVNGRYIRDRSLSHALGEAYRGLLMVNRYPVAFLFLELPPEDVDVNIHPTKVEVRFRDSHEQYSHVLATLREKFLKSDLTARLQPPLIRPDAAGEAEHAAGVRNSLRDFFARPSAGAAPWDPAAQRPYGAAAAPPPARSPGPAGSAPAAPAPLGGHSEAGFDTNDAAPFTLRPGPGGDYAARLPFPPASNSAIAMNPLAPGAAPPPWQVPGQTTHDPAGPGQPAAAPTPPVAPLAAGGNAIQVHNAYLVVETPDGMMVIDQHALHERILYEELRERVLGGRFESQRLLVPEMVDLSAAEVALVTDYADLLSELGLDAEPFGGTTVALHTYPAMLANLPADRMFRDVVDTLTAGARTPNRRDLLDRLLHTIACKAAVKAGQRLTPEEIQALVAQQHLAQDAHHCPHGRPTALVFTKNELERQFKRT
jgi:DNA mismatch repair protein MutL